MNILVGVNSHSDTMESISHGLTWRERWLSQDLLVEDILCLKEYLSSFHPRHVVGAGHVLSNPMAIIRHWYDGEDDDVYLHKCMFVSLNWEQKSQNMHFSVFLQEFSNLLIIILVISFFISFFLCYHENLHETLIVLNIPFFFLSTLLGIVFPKNG